MQMRLDENIKQLLIKKIEDGTSINKISNELNLAKSTIYYHYKKIKGKRYQKAKIKQIGYSKIEGEIVGIFAGDGSQHLDKDRGSYAVSVYFGNRNIDYAIYVQRIFEEHFRKEIPLRKATDHAIKLDTKSKDIFLYFHNYLDFEPKVKHCTVKLKKMDLPPEFLIGFIKGFLDTDGWISKAKDRIEPRIGFSTTSKELAKQIKEIMVLFNVKSGLYTIDKSHVNEKTVYNIQIWKESVNKFLNVVQPFKLKKFRARSLVVKHSVGKNFQTSRISGSIPGESIPNKPK